MKRIKLFNGTVYKQGRSFSIFIGAYSQKHAVELLEQAGHHTTLSDIVNYWHKNCWGVQMTGIETQIGVWKREERFDAKVERIV